LVDGAKEEAGDILVEDGVIAAVGKNLKAKAKDAEVLDCTGCVVMPGLVDVHVHLREPGREDEETVASGARAAVAGGFTDIASMANTSPVADNGSVIEYVRRCSTGAGGARVHPVGALTKGLAGQELAEMGDMARSGAVAFSDDGNTPASARMMRRGLEYAKGLGLPVLAHCMDPALGQGGAMREGLVGTRLGLPGIPAAAEAAIVAREIELCELVGTPVHIQHISAARSLDLIRTAKARGLPVTCEVTPHHLFLEDSACEGYDPVYKVNPPLPTQEDRMALLEALIDGDIDCIASDHAPHAPHEKELEFEEAPFGLVGLETTLPLVVSELVKPGRLSWPALVELMAHGPRRILGLEDVRFSAGAPADVTVVDPELVMRVGDRWHSKSRNCPWWGRELSGWARHVVVGGEARLRDGALVLADDAAPSDDYGSASCRGVG
jgi:dihydroorotase